MSDKKTWVRFRKPGVSIGYAYFEGDVAELPADAADAGMEAGVLVRAKDEEIKAAQAALARIAPSAKA